MKHYLFFWLALTSCLMLVMGAINLVVDPYGIFYFVDKAGFNGIKPAAGGHGATGKYYQVMRVQPRGVVLGNSRAEVGFDPLSVAWPEKARPVFNLALPGTGPRASLESLQHVLNDAQQGHAEKPEVVVWGIDFMNFLDNIKEPGQSPPKDNRLLASSSGSKFTIHFPRQVKDYAEATLSLDAFVDSIRTIASQSDPYAENLTAFGFNPMHDYLKISADEGYWAVFRQRDIENIKAYLRRSTNLYDSAGNSSPDLDSLRAVIRLCRQHGIELHLVIYPYHAHLLEIFRITGHWPAFEAWKREVVRIVASESSQNKDNTVSLWDFSQFNELTEEAVPAKADRKSKMHWYWEAGHFKKELGELVLDRLFGHQGAREGFGVLLNQQNLEEHLALERAREADYRLRYSKDVDQLQQIDMEILSRQH